MRRSLGLIALLVIALGIPGGPAGAQFGRLKDKLKQKVEQKVDQKVDAKVDQTANGSKKPEAGKAPEAGEKASGEAKGEEAGGAAKEGTAAAGGTATSEDMALLTKYDFIPGDRVIFYDDLSGEETGEFPSRWNLDHGVFEIARKGDRNWILCTDDGRISPKIPAGPLPPKYTFELDIMQKKPGTWGHSFNIEWVDAKGEVIGEFFLGNNTNSGLKMNGKDLASKTIEELVPGAHTMRIMATKSSVKCYIDHERVANVPALEGFQPAGFFVEVKPGSVEAEHPMLMGALRYAEGGKTLKEQLDEAGRIVTHGILFDSGSDKIKAESYKTLADIGGLLTGSPSLRVSIEGHTDSDGADAANLTLSQKRAEAVKTYLVETYKIDGGRLETKGWGEGKPIDTNNTAEGKANNRRVELVKL